MRISSARTRASAALIAVAVIWGISAVVIKATLTQIPPFEFLYFRFLLLFPVTLPWYIWYLRKHPVKKEELFALTAFAFMSTTLNLSLVFLGFERTSAIDGNLLGTVAPIFIIILGVVLLKEKVGNREGWGMLLVVLGSLITVLQPILSNSAFPLKNLLGNMIILGGSIVWAFFVLLSKKNFKHFSPLHITLHGSMIALPTFALLAFAENGGSLPALSTLTVNLPALIGVLYMAFVSYIGAYFFYEYGMSKIEISEGSIFTYLQPLITTPLAVMFLGEAITIPFLIGAAIIASGVALSEWR